MEFPSTCISAADSEIPVAKRIISAYRSPSSSRTICGDRFIPCRSSSNFDLLNLPNSAVSNGTDSAYTSLLKSALLGPEYSGGVDYFQQPKFADGGRFGDGNDDDSGGDGILSQFSPPNRNIFKYKTETRKCLRSRDMFEFDDLHHGVPNSPVKIPRKIPTSPYKILDAPSLQDDFYTNLVDWSSQNVLAVGLGNCVYLWHASNNQVVKLCDLGDDDTVCSVSWANSGARLAIGTGNGKVQLWDVSCSKRIKTMEGHRSRVGALAWSPSLLSSGSRDKSILQRDTRTKEDYVSKLTGHKSVVCGLKWSHDNKQLASGGNDNQLLVWNQHKTQPVLKYCEHTAAVKAIAWSPHLYGLLASGGGTVDRTIRFWNTTTNLHVNRVETGSQVCNLAWSKNVNELVSTHGFSENQIVVWKYPTMSKLATLTGHAMRVLYLSVSPDGQTIVTGAGDETLRFWNVFPPRKSRKTESDIGASFRGRSLIR